MLMRDNNPTSGNLCTQTLEPIKHGERFGDLVRKLQRWHVYKNSRCAGEKCVSVPHIPEEIISRIVRRRRKGITLIGSTLEYQA